MKMKKLVVVLLAALTLSVAVPNVTPTAPLQAAKKKVTVKISKKSATIIEGKTLTLKISGTKKKVSWKSSKKSVATVNSKGKVTAKKAGTATITATVNKKKYTCKVTVKQDEVKINKKLKEIGKWLDRDIDGFGYGTGKSQGFVAIDCYIEFGTESIDINSVLEQLGNSLKKVPEYDKFIKGLRGKKYDKLKELWTMTSEYIMACYKNLMEYTPKPHTNYYGYIPYDAIRNACYKINDEIEKLIK